MRTQLAAWLLLFFSLFALALVYPSLASGEPLLIRGVYWRQYEAAGAYSLPPAEVAANIDSMMPADCYVLGTCQYTSWPFEAFVEELRRRGKKVLRYLSPTTLRKEHLDKPQANFDRMLAAYFVDRGYVLKDAAGEILYYRWYGEPYILRWDLISEEEIRDLCSRLAYVRGDIWELDVWYSRLRPWMLERRQEFDQEALDALYDRESWRSRRAFFLETLQANEWGPESDRLLIVNGESLFWYDEGLRVFFENAPAHEFDEMLPRWRARPGCVLEVRTPPASASIPTRILIWQRINVAVDAWLEDGKARDAWLWVDNEAGLYDDNHTRPLALFVLARQEQWRLQNAAEEVGE